MRCLKRACLPVLFMILSCVVQAQEIDLLGRTGWYQYSRRWLEIYAERIENNLDVTTGSLALRVRVTTEPSGGDFLGSYLIGSLNLGQVRAGFRLTDIDSLARYWAPPAGLYYTSVTLEEYNNGAFDVVDYEDLDGIVNFGGWGEAAGTGGGPNGDLYFAGEIAWASENGWVQLSANQIINDRTTKSGPLRWRLYATEAPYDGGTLDGIVLATKTLARLRPGFGFQNYLRSARFLPPSTEGTYYTVLTLEERVRGVWYIVDHVAFTSPSIF